MIEDRKDKKPSDSTSLFTIHPELTAPIVVPEAAVQGPPKQNDAKEQANTPGVKGADTPRETVLGVATRMQIENEGVPDELTGNESVNANATPAEKSSPETSLPEPNQLDSKIPVAATADRLNGMPSTENTLQRGRKPTAEIASVSMIGAAPRKSLEMAKGANDRPQSAGLAGSVKHGPTPLPNIKMPITPSDATVAAGKSDPPRAAAAEAVPVAPPVNPISNASAKEIADSHMATKAASQAKDLDPALATETKNIAQHVPASELAKVKDRNSASNSKDRIGKDRGKDPRTGSTDSGKFASTQADRAVAGTTNLAGGGGKDSGTGSPNTSSQVKQVLVKPSAGISSSATTAAEADGPDEAVPITTSSPITAKFVQGMNGSEFRVGMQSQEFGSIDIRTSVARHMFSAQISVEHSDVAKSLATELPALYSKLADQHVPVANIVIQGQSMASSSGFAQDTQQQQNWRAQANHGGASSNVDAILPVTVETLDSQGRLDIRI